MLSLAKLEGLSELVDTAEFDLVGPIARLSEERSPRLAANDLSIEYALHGSDLSPISVPMFG